MSDSDFRDKAAKIARGVSRYLERERAAGLGDLLAQGAARELASRATRGTGKQETQLQETQLGKGESPSQVVSNPRPERPGSEGVTPDSGGVSNPRPERPGSEGVTPRLAEPGIGGARLGVSEAEHEAQTRVPRRTPDAPAGDLAPSVRPAVVRPSAVNLFGEPQPEPIAAAATVSPLDLPLPSHHAPLNPRGQARREILASSLPVLEEVASESRACKKCALCETRTQAVPGVGSAQSGIVFVGEAPGAEEDRLGEPFVGRAGELLTRIIKAMDDARIIPGVALTRETVYICNVLKCRPPENRNPLPFEIESCSPYLRRQLEVLKPRVICCLGKFAAELLIGVKGTIASLRGQVFRYHGAKLIVTYHPAACLRNPNYKRPVWEDMQRLAQEYLTD